MHQSAALPRRSLETISMWALVITIAATLFAVVPTASFSFLATKSFILAAGALIVFALYILARLSRGTIVFPPFVLTLALWLPLIAYALSSAFSGVPFKQALWGVMLEPDTLGFMLVAAFLGTLTVLIVRRPDQYQSFLRIFGVISGLIIIVQTVTILLGQFISSTVSPTFSLLGSFQDLSSFVGLSVVGILVTLRFVELSLVMKRVLVGVGILSLFLLAIANSLLVWILVALVSLGFFVEAILKRSAKSGMNSSDLEDTVAVGDVPGGVEESNHSLVTPLVVLAISIFFLIGGTVSGALAESLNVNVLNVRPSWQSTFAIGQKVYENSALFGSGPTTFGAEWLKYRDASLNSTLFWNLDLASGIGFVPTSFVTTGLLGVLAWIAFFGLFAFFGLRTLILRASEDSSVRYASILSFVATLYLFAIALFEQPNIIMLALLFVCAGFFISTTRYARGGEQKGVIFSRSPRLGFIIVFSLTILLLASVATGYSLVGRYIASIQFTRASTAFAANNLDAADSAVQKSISFSPSTAAYQLQATIAKTRVGEIVTSTKIPVAQAQQQFQTTIASGINAALTATRIAPADYQNWVVLGNLYAQAVPLRVTGAYDSAKAAYRKAQELNPTSPQIPYIMAQLDIANKDTKSAKENLRSAITLKQDYTAAIFLLSQLEVQEGNVKEALASALAAAYFSPNDPSILFQVGILSAASGDFQGAVLALTSSVAASPDFANARYLLSAVYAKQGDMRNALAQMEAIAAISQDNASLVETQLTALKAGKNPFPANILNISPPTK